MRMLVLGETYFSIIVGRPIDKCVQIKLLQNKSNKLGRQ